MARCVFGAPLIPLLVSVASAKNPSQSDPKAVAFATQSIAAPTNGTATADVTLSGNAIWTTGTTTETGTTTATDAVQPFANLHSPELFGTSAGSRPSVNHDILCTE